MAAPGTTSLPGKPALPTPAGPQHPQPGTPPSTATPSRAPAGHGWPEGCEQGPPAAGAPSLWEAGNLCPRGLPRPRHGGDGAGAACRGCWPLGDRMPAREECSWAPDAPACPPAGRRHRPHRGAGPAPRTESARAQQRSPLGAETRWTAGSRPPSSSVWTRASPGTQGRRLSCSGTTLWSGSLGLKLYLPPAPPSSPFSSSRLSLEPCYSFPSVSEEEGGNLIFGCMFLRVGHLRHFKSSSRHSLPEPSPLWGRLGLLLPPAAVPCCPLLSPAALPPKFLSNSIGGWKGQGPFWFATTLRPSTRLCFSALLCSS